jgi:hypothetical protein
MAVPRSRKEDLLRRYMYARAEMTVGYHRREARRKEVDQRFGPCVGDVEGVECPLHGFHEVSAPEEPAGRDEHLAAIVPLVLMLVVIVVCALVGAPAWVGLPLVVLAGPVLGWAWFTVLRRGKP